MSRLEDCICILSHHSTHLCTDLLQVLHIKERKPFLPDQNRIILLFVKFMSSTFSFSFLLQMSAADLSKSLKSSIFVQSSVGNHKICIIIVTYSVVADSLLVYQVTGSHDISGTTGLILGWIKKLEYKNRM